MSEDQVSGDSQGNEPEVRLELTNQGVRQVWALYSQERTDGERFGNSDPTYSFFLRELPALLWRGKWFLVFSLAVALGVAAAYIADTTPVYNVSALLLVEKRAVPLNEDERTFRGTNFLATQAEIMQSPAIIYRAVEGMPREVVEHARRGGVEDPLRMMVKSFTATRVVGTDVVALSLRAEDRLLGEQLVSAIVDSYRQYVLEYALAGPSEALDLMTRTEADLRQQLEDMQERYRDLRAEGGSLGDGRDALALQMAMLERQAQKLVETRIKRIDLENQLSSMRTAQQEGNGELVGAGAKQLQQELWKVQTRAGELAQRYSEDHPELRAINEQILSLRAQLSASEREAPALLERELRATRETERRLASLYETDFVRGKELDAHRLQEEELVAEVERVSRLHQSAMMKLQERQITLEAITQGNGGVVVRLLDGPKSSDQPMWPQPTLVFMCATIVGIAIGLGVTLVVDRLRERARAARSAKEVARPARTPYRPAAVETTEPAAIRGSVVDMARER